MQYIQAHLSLVQHLTKSEYSSPTALPAVLMICFVYECFVQKFKKNKSRNGIS